MDSTVTFTSPRFRPILPEESQVNPGRYGAELAYWLCAELAREGLVTSYPEYEDWGWFIEHVTDEGDELWLCCGNVDEHEDRWRCALEPKSKGLFARSRPDPESARPLLEALARVLEGEASVRDVEWSTE